MKSLFCMVSAAGAIMLIAIVSLTALPALAQTAAYRAPRLKGTDRPDLNGLW